MDPAPEQAPQYCPSHGVWVAKASLRWVQILIGILILALTGAILGNEVGNVLPFIIASPSVALALLWDLSEVITIHRRKAHRGISPPAVVVMDLIVVLALVGSNAGLGYIGMATDLNDTLAYPISAYYREGSLKPWELDGPVKDVKYMALVVVVFMCLLTSLHISTFIIACYETHIRKKPLAPPAQPTTIVVMANSTSSPQPTVPGGQVYYQMATPPPGHPPGQMYFVPVQGVSGTVAGQVAGDVKPGLQ
ncbi:hypothetical protein QBC39DRAFT_350579 [Podospora conica]|nr:hypothetical protein QBC39DRAFT_350579 [Schizothecium conicum]